MGNELSSEYLKEHYGSMSPTSNQLLAGAFGGYMGLYIFVPIDLLKCRAQMNKDGMLCYKTEVRTVLRR